jgi:hypothetical protein
MDIDENTPNSFQKKFINIKFPYMYEILFCGTYCNQKRREPRKQTDSFLPQPEHIERHFRPTEMHTHNTITLPIHARDLCLPNLDRVTSQHQCKTCRLNCLLTQIIKDKLHIPFIHSYSQFRRQHKLPYLLSCQNLATLYYQSSTLAKYHQIRS